MAGDRHRELPGGVELQCEVSGQGRVHGEEDARMERQRRGGPSLSLKGKRSRQNELSKARVLGLQHSG